MLFRKKIERSCAYCTHGVLLEDGNVLSSKKGLRTIDQKSPRLHYEPSKRIPSKAKVLDFTKYDQEDFSL